MAYFADLSEYAYGSEEHPNVVHVGWLDGEHSFPTGLIAPRLISKLKLLAKTPVELYRGQHLCNICSEPEGLVKKDVPDRVVIDPTCSWAIWAEQRSGNGEIRVNGDRVVFAAPVLIVHYIEDHLYLPPSEFLRAVEQTLR